MSTLGTYVNLYDLAQMKKPGGGIMDMVESMTEIQDILKDIPFREANEMTSHRFMRRGSLPSGTWVDLNNGISASKGGKVAGRAEIGMLESRLQIDNRFMDIEPDWAGFVEGEAQAHYIGLAQDVADAIVSGTISGGYRFASIESHIDDPTQTDQFGKSMCSTYGGTGGDTTSILAIDWGPNKVYGVYPQAHAFAGVEKEEHPDTPVTGLNSATMFAYVCDFKWYLGLVVADDRCIRRIANIETTGTSNNILASTFTVKPIIDALTSMWNMGRTSKLYGNRTVWGQLWKSAIATTNVNYTATNPWQQPEYYFDGTPYRFTDSLLDTETAI